MQRFGSALLKGAALFCCGTFLSRLSGVCRDVCMATSFGATRAVAGLMLAYRLASLLRRLLGESALAAAFIPHFEKMCQRNLGKTFYQSFCLTWSIVLIGVITVGEGVLYFVRCKCGLSASARELALLVQVMLPGLFFIVLFGLNSAVLQYKNKFFLNSASSIFFNFTWIIAIYFLRHAPASQAMLGLAIAIVLAFAVQWLVSCLQLKSYILSRWTFSAFCTSTRFVFRAFFCSIIGVGALQINSALDGFFARDLALEGPSFLWYAFRLQQAPLALIAISLSTAILPQLAKQKAPHESLLLLRSGLRVVVRYLIPAMGILWILGFASLNLLYGRGAFTVAAQIQTLYCLWGYTCALFPTAFVLLTAPVFYAQRRHVVAMKGVLLSVVINALFNLLSVKNHWPVASIAVATSLGAFFNAVYLNYKGKVFFKQPIFDNKLKAEAALSCFGTLVAMSLAAFVGYQLHDPTLDILQFHAPCGATRALVQQIQQFSAQLAVFSAVFFGIREGISRYVLRTRRQAEH